MNRHRAIEVSQSGIEVLRALPHAAEHQVRFEVVDVDRQLLPERAFGPGLVTEPEQGASVRAIRRRQARVELKRAFELGLRLGIIEPVEMSDSHQEVSFGGVARLEDAVDVLLALTLVAGSNQCGPEHVRECEIVLEHRLARLQQRHRVPILTGLQVAVGENQIGVLRVGIGRDDDLQRLDRLVRPSRLVVGERQVQPDRRVRRIDFQRRVVLRDRVVELAELDVGGAEIGQRVDARRVDRRAPSCRRRWRRSVAGLLHLQTAEEDPIEILGAGLSEQRERQDQQEQRGQKTNPDHGSCCVRHVEAGFSPAVADTQPFDYSSGGCTARRPELQLGPATAQAGKKRGKAGRLPP